METINNFVGQSPQRFIKMESFKADGRDAKLIVVSGTYYDMGYLLGRELGKQLVDEVTQGYKSIKRKVAIFLRKDKNFDEELETSLHKFLPQIPDECRMEFAGIYAGCQEAGCNFSDPQLLEKFLILIELGEQECTLFAAQPPFTLGDTYQMRDLDYYKNISMGYIPTLLIRIPQNAHGQPIDNAYASIDFLSNITGGVTTGINEHGVAFSQSRGPFLKRFSYQGMPIKSLIQQVLSKTDNAVAARSFIQKNPPATAHFVIISDPKRRKDSLQLLFTGPAIHHAYEYDEQPDLSLIHYEDPQLRFYKPMDGIVYWTDMVDRRVNNAPADFFMKDFHQLLTQNAGKFSAENGLSIAQTVGNDITFITALYNTSKMEAWIAYATRKTPAHNNAFLHFNLNKYFAYKKALL